MFQPAFCPRPDCPSRCGSAAFSYRLRGFFRRRCDQRIVQRFRCHACAHDFSEQTFHLDYRLKRPQLLLIFFKDRVSKVTHRQSARIHGCSRSTEERHFRRLCLHCEAFHAARLREIAARGGRGRVFLLDELETYEQNRLKKPLTVPILMARRSLFLIDARVGTLPARRRRARRDAGGPGDIEERKSQSTEVVQAALERLREVSPKDRPLVVRTDRKRSYARLLRQIFGKRCIHRRTSSRLERNTRNPLFRVNHTLAMLRDGLSKLVRETWATTKLRRWLEGQLAIWICFRNYVRGKTNKDNRTPAMVLKAQDRRWSKEELLEWRVFPA